jgi:hypothetical protein
MICSDHKQQVDIYQHLGFVVRGETPVENSVGSVTMWCLSKET